MLSDSNTHEISEIRVGVACRSSLELEVPAKVTSPALVPPARSRCKLKPNLDDT